MDPNQSRKGRGAGLNPHNRFHAVRREPFDDGWGAEDEQPQALPTTLSMDTSRTVITTNQSPDVGFDRSINPYRGCEHGCAYCFARPTHAYLDLSPGLDFETRLLYKPDAPRLLKKELSRPGYSPAPIAVGINTDAYQPVEREQKLTRGILEVLNLFHHPFSIVTKSALVERDLDILRNAASRGLVNVMVSVTTLDRKLCRRLEPRAASPERRLETIRKLSENGIPVGVLVAPVIPVLTENELEHILEEARAAGARDAGYILLRLPHETREIFRDWLRTHEPLKADHVMGRVRELRGGKDYDSRYGTRQTGTGVFADVLKKRFSLARKRLGFPGLPDLDASRFRIPGTAVQPPLF
ncbi:MAG TPA: PA0069 family radical SAM protein [Nitrospiria bacterium]